MSSESREQSSGNLPGSLEKIMAHRAVGVDSLAITIASTMWAAFAVYTIRHFSRPREEAHEVHRHNMTLAGVYGAGTLALAAVALYNVRPRLLKLRAPGIVRND
jgi:NhaP-type Na+/H+ or K+/H+ antiporter